MNEHSEAGRLALPVPAGLRRVHFELLLGTSGGAIKQYADDLALDFLSNAALVRMYPVQGGRWIVEAFLPTEQEKG